MEELFKLCTEYFDHIVAFAALFGIVVEVTPIIKINPISAILRWIGNSVNKDLNVKIVEQSNKLDKFISETKEDNQVIMRHLLLQTYRHVLTKGYIIEEDNANFHSMLERYKANGGNSYIVHDVTPRLETFHVYLSDEDAERHFEKFGNY